MDFVIVLCRSGKWRCSIDQCGTSFCLSFISFGYLVIASGSVVQTKVVWPVVLQGKYTSKCVCVTQIDPNWRKLGGIVSQDANAFTPYFVNLSELSEELLKTKFDIFLTRKNVSSQKSCFQMRWSCSRECKHLVFRPLLRDILSKYEINDKSPEI